MDVDFFFKGIDILRKSFSNTVITKMLAFNLYEYVQKNQKIF